VKGEPGKVKKQTDIADSSLHGLSSELKVVPSPNTSFVALELHRDFYLKATTFPQNLTLNPNPNIK
jgi:hypothetical protein